jgi:uncharacterized damage-inducible protein DinB
MDLIAEMYALVESVREELAELIDNLTPDEKARRGSLQGWSAKDMLAHLAFWNSHFNRQLEKGLAGEKVPDSGDYLDQVNDGVLFEHLEQPFAEAQAEEEAAYQRFRQIAAEISPEDMLDPKKVAFFQGRTLLDRSLGTHGYHVAFHISDFYLKSGQIDRARSLQENLTERLSAFPTWKTNAIYNLGCFYSLHDMKSKAIAQLKKAFALNPDLIAWAKQDSDIDPLRDMKEYKELVGE